MNETKKIVMAALAVVVIGSLMVIGLRLQAQTLAVKTPPTITVAPVETDSGAVLGESNSDYSNPLNGVYVNPFAQ